MGELVTEVSEIVTEHHPDSCIRNVAVRDLHHLMWLETGVGRVGSTQERTKAVQPFTLTLVLHFLPRSSPPKSPSSQSYYHPPTCPLRQQRQSTHTHILTARIADLATQSRLQTIPTWPFMGYYTSTEPVTPAATAQNKIAVGVFLGTAAGLSRTESSFANLDWLLAAGPP